MLFNMEDMWSGLINNFAFQIVNPDPDAVVYIEEIALFPDQESAYVYAGLTAEDTTAEDTTETPTEEATTEAPAEEATTDPAEDATGNVTETPAEQTSGCGSVMGLGVVALLGAAFIALKKDRV